MQRRKREEITNPGALFVVVVSTLSVCLSVCLFVSSPVMTLIGATLSCIYGHK